ncbi:MAG: 2-oxoacid:acceptor oxidoreductase family protein [Endomicrobiia bacterium]
MYNEIFIAGSGGQGILSLGRILISAAVEESKFVTYYPSYGAEMRGGTANCMIKISDTEIYSPVIESPTEMVIMNTPSYLKFVKKFNPKNFLFLNSSLIDEKKEIQEYIAKNLSGLNIVKLDVSDIANRIGNVLVANMVMLGVLLKKVNLVKMVTVKNILEKKFDKKIALLNTKALETGFEQAK